jgi:hypothetical protein
VKKEDKVIRGKFRLGENGFPSMHEKQEKVMKDVARILKKTKQRDPHRGKE